MTTIAFTHVDIRPHRRVVDATVTTGRGVHRVGHLPGTGPDSGWFCDCSRSRACPHIDAVAALIPAIARRHAAVPAIPPKETPA